MVVRLESEENGQSGTGARSDGGSMVRWVDVLGTISSNNNDMHSVIESGERRPKQLGIGGRKSAAAFIAGSCCDDQC